MKLLREIVSDHLFWNAVPFFAIKYNFHYIFFFPEGSFSSVFKYSTPYKGLWQKLWGSTWRSKLGWGVGSWLSCCEWHNSYSNVASQTAWEAHRHQWYSFWNIPGGCGLYYVSNVELLNDLSLGRQRCFLTWLLFFFFSFFLSFFFFFVILEAKTQEKMR